MGVTVPRMRIGSLHSIKAQSPLVRVPRRSVPAAAQMQRCPDPDIAGYRLTEQKLLPPPGHEAQARGLLRHQGGQGFTTRRLRCAVQPDGLPSQQRQPVGRQMAFSGQQGHDLGALHIHANHIIPECVNPWPDQPASLIAFSRNASACAPSTSAGRCGQYLQGSRSSSTQPSRTPFLASSEYWGD